MNEKQAGRISPAASAARHANCSDAVIPLAELPIAVIWSYFNNRVQGQKARFATRCLAQPIYRDVGATIPT